MNTFKVGRAILSKPVLTTVLKRNLYVATVLNDKSYYDVLRVPENATQSEIKEAYYKLSKVYHPDIKKDDQALNMFRQITEAYDVLSNVKSRMQYDKGIGKDLPFDDTKEPFYASLYSQSYKKGVHRAQVDKILNKKPIIDEHLETEYRDRIADYKIVKNDLLEHKMKPYGEYGLQRVLFCFFFSVAVFYARIYEHATGF